MMSSTHYNVDSSEKEKLKAARWLNVMQRKEANINKRQNILKNGLAKSFSKQKERDNKFKEDVDVLKFQVKKQQDHFLEVSNRKKAVENEF